MNDEKINGRTKGFLPLMGLTPEMKYIIENTPEIEVTSSGDPGNIYIYIYIYIYILYTYLLLLVSLIS